ncbi:hypothetical protein Trydic_g3335 [Trypoxylus dichotomus]
MNIWQFIFAGITYILDGERLSHLEGSLHRLSRTRQKKTGYVQTGWSGTKAINRGRDFNLVSSCCFAVGEVVPFYPQNSFCSSGAVYNLNW